MTTLTVALPLDRPTPSTEFSYALSVDGRTLASHGSAPVALLPSATVLVLRVPARCLSWHSVKLPPVATSRLRAALEGVLEERLLDEPAELALALGPHGAADGQFLVAVCDKAWLRAILDFFELSKRPATRVVPEFSPPSDGSAAGVVVTGTVEDPLLARTDARGVLCVPLALAKVLLDVGAPDAAALAASAEPAVAELAERLLGRPVAILPAAERLLASAQSSWELAQFDLAISSRGRMLRRSVQLWQQFALASAWRPVHRGLAVLLVANLVGLNAWAWRQQADLLGKREQTTSLLRQTFPRIRTIVDAPLQMERELARLRRASGALSTRDLEIMLGAAGAALPAGHGATAIEYVPGELVLKGLGMSATQSLLVASKLAGQAYVARMDGERLVLRAGAAP